MAKILHVEDNPANRMLIRQVLELEGHTVVEAVDGPGGVEAAQREMPDLILMDINIPGMDGYETTTRLKSMAGLENVPVIALTAKAMAGDRERALTAGCDGYISKPVDIDLLPDQLAEFLGGRRETVTTEQEKRYLREYNVRLVDRLDQKIKELTEANRKLAHTDAMKSRFINLAAHELRTPLAAAQGYLSMLATPGSKFMASADPTTQEILHGVISSVDRLQGIVQDMLDVTRIEAGTLQLKQSPVNLDRLLKKIAAEFAPTVAQRQQTFQVADAGHIPSLWADGERVLQILRNLVSNAVKYTPNGGQIKIDVEITGVEGRRAQQFVKITVSDTGVGIPAEEQELIFETFHEVRRIEHHSTSKTGFMGGGAGLGLPIARGVAEAHGGSLWVESPGYNPKTCPGSIFHLILPLGDTPTN
ncbi:MAG: hybrid sensor histidine kinase/response regulator [Chloroflexi bacterium]|nr:MAG: hybrid sensor histidine kinase/response regulator [Chloroflexota bacterium]